MPAGVVIVQNINPFMHDVDKWLNILGISCGVKKPAFS